VEGRAWNRKLIISVVGGSIIKQTKLEGEGEKRKKTGCGKQKQKQYQ
jgi:hypothetical protein